jgi:GNAT superfamily N-acetyltransferase
VGGTVSISTEPLVGLLARLADLEDSEIERRLNEGNQIFLLRVDGEPAAYGWSATGPAHIGGLSLAFEVPPGERYLWDFMTLPAFRGLGLYPLLLQAILRRQSAEAEWFWIAHGRRNAASRQGILKAGFRLAGQVWWLQNGELILVGPSEASPAVTHGAAGALGLKHLHNRLDQQHGSAVHDEA